MPERPYFCVTGISEPDDSRKIAPVLDRQNFIDKSHLGVVGYLVSSRTIEGYTNEYAKYPPLEILPVLLESTSNAVNAIHLHATPSANLHQLVDQMFQRIAVPVDILQINSRSPKPEQVETIKNRYPDLKIVIPISKWLLSLPRGQAVEVLDRYKRNFDYLLVDPSGGRGTDLDLDLVAGLYRLLIDKYPDKGIIFAGGLTPENLTEKLPRLVAKIRTDRFGVDAESGLRVGNETDPHGGVFSVAKAKKFISQADSFFNS